MSDFLKNTNDFDSLNLSDISEVDPDEIEKIVKSAGELDKKYINLETLKTTFKENTPSSNSAIGVRSHQIPSEEIEGNDSKSAQSSQKEAVNLLASEEVQFGGNPMSVIEGGRRRGRGSGDWLGLKDSPEESITTIGEKMDEGRTKRPPSAKGRLLSELFGDPKPQPETTTPFTDVERDANYLPSRGNRRAGSPRLLGNDVPKLPDDSKVFLDEPKLFPEEPKMILETPKVIPEVRKPAGQTPSVLPDWLLGGEKLVEQNKSEPTKNEVTDKKEIRAPSPGPPLLTNYTPVQTNEIVALLANVQKQLGSAMTKRNENLQNYMKVLMLEAERVLVHTEDLAERVNDTSVKIAEDRDAESTKNKNMELMKEKDDQIHSVQINLTDLELQNNRQRLEIDNLKVTHEMEIEMLKKNHSYELTVFESRIERMKASFDEIENEFKEKIAKLKENETSLLSEHKERLERAEQSRLAEVEKLGELHQAALQQALALSLPLNNAGRVIRIPLITNPPKDETELSERETALLEKERQIEVLKGVMELEKEELEGKRLELEDRDRDLRRKEKGAKVREEAREAEAARERSQLDALALQIKLMREEAIREQGEIAKEKLELAAERARLEATYSIQGRTDTSIPPLDIIQARVEVEAALETAKEAKEAAENERRKHAERRHTVEQISWEQKEADLRLDNREKHLMKMLENAEKIRDEGFAALEEAKDLKSETDRKENDIKDQIKRIEAQERILSKERLDIAKEKIELERKRSQLDIFLPDLLASEELSLHVPRVYVDPKAVILRLKAEREFESATLFPT